MSDTAWRASRLSLLPEYLFVEIDRKKAAALAAGKDVIDFGIGDPDRPTPNFVVDQMAESIRIPSNHRYASSIGSSEFRKTAARYFKQRFEVDVDPASEVVVAIGTKETIGHLPLAVVNAGEFVLVPDPGYPVYTSGTIFAGGSVHAMPLRAENRWLPDLREIPPDVCRRAKLMFINYPNNPTAATASLDFFERVLDFAKEHEILVCQDAAYADVYFEDPPPSMLQIRGAKDHCIEMHSLSKTFNMTGWRIGFAVGNGAALAALAAVKSNLDSGAFGAVQQAGIEALNNIDHVEVRAQKDVYRKRRDIIVGGLREAGWQVDAADATFYVWARCPGDLDSMAVATRILEESAVVAIPGIGFGKGGEGYVRFALTVDEDRSKEAMQRIAQLKW